MRRVLVILALAGLCVSACTSITIEEPDTKPCQPSEDPYRCPAAPPPQPLCPTDPAVCEDLDDRAHHP